MATFEIPDYNVPKLEEKIAKLNKKAQKLGVPEITIHVSGHKNVLCHDLVRPYSSEWGGGVVYKMHTAVGDVVTCFSMKGDAKEGEQITIKGTVKKQNEYNGSKETILNRVVVQA
jgi:hypothetical protein